MFTFNRLVLFFLSLWVSPLVFAGEGWYVGGGALYNDVSAHMKYDTILPSGNPFEEMNARAHHFTWGGQVHGGYQWLIPMPLGLSTFAIELAGEFQNASLEQSVPPPTSATTTPIIVHMRLEDSVLLTAKPGYFILNNVYVYGEVGVIYTQMGDIKTDAGQSSGSGYQRFGDYGDEGLIGVRAGAGINYLITKSLSLEVGWRYTGYDSFTKERFTFPSTGQKEKIDITDINTEQVFLGFHYYFD